MKKMTLMALVAVVLLISGAAHATYPSTYLLGGFTVNVLSNNTTFYSDLSNIDYYHFHFGNAGGQSISGDANRSGSATLLFTADQGKWFTQVSVGTYGDLHASIDGGHAWAWNSVGLTGGASYGPVTPPTWSIFVPGNSTDIGNRDGYTWPHIPVNASSFTVNFSEGLESRGPGGVSGGPSSVTPGYLFFETQLTQAPPPVPIPSNLLLLGPGLVGLAFLGRRRLLKRS